MENKKFFRCPDCGKKLARIEEKATAAGVFLWCSRCRKEKKLYIDEPKKQSHF
jgi:transcription elongation factor Elf1